MLKQIEDAIKLENEGKAVNPQYRFYTDNTGNNHALVRQILKRRPWFTRIDNIKDASRA